MTKRNSLKRTALYVRIGVGLCVLVILLSLNMMIPISVALTAGVSGISFILFSLSAILGTVMFFVTKKLTIRILAVTTIIISIFSLVIPVAAYMNTAKQAGASLSLNPTTYLTFSGSADIEPESVKTYKTIGKQNLKLSYYKPETTEDSPVVVLLHGGGWRYGSHLETGQWPKILTDAGFAVVSVEYRLANDTYHSWEDAPADVHDAINYLKNNASEYSIDPSRIHLMGQSAGGHLALLEAYRFESVQSVIALYAPIDLVLDYETSRDKSAELDFIGGPPKQFSERYESLSPISYVNPQDPPTLLVQGSYDDLVHSSQATRLGAVLDGANVPNDVIIIPLTGHSFENQRGGFATQIATQRVLQFLK